MFASTVIGPVALPPPQMAAGSPSGPQTSGPRGERIEAARTDTATTHAGHRGEETRAEEKNATPRVTEGDAPSKPGAETLTEAELRQLKQMKVTDQAVRRHELSHQVAGGAYTGSASYSYERGPDGHRYAVAGEVPIDYGPVQGDPRATIDKMQQVISAALAPADPSPKDLQVAAQARQYMLTAKLEQAQQQGEMDGARRDAQASSTEAQGGTGEGASGADKATQGAGTADTGPVVELSQYDIIARAATIGARESLRSLA